MVRERLSHCMNHFGASQLVPMWTRINVNYHPCRLVPMSARPMSNGAHLNSPCIKSYPCQLAPYQNVPMSIRPMSDRTNVNSPYVKSYPYQIASWQIVPMSTRPISNRTRVNSLSRTIKWCQLVPPINVNSYLASKDQMMVRVDIFHYRIDVSSYPFQLVPLLSILYLPCWVRVDI